MEQQLPIDFSVAAARAATNEGIARAVDHADRVDAQWSLTAYTFLATYARTHTSFTAEDVRLAAGDQLSAPPDQRAWGAVMRKAVSAQVIRGIGFVTARDPKVHRCNVRLWQSLVYPGATAAMLKAMGSPVAQDSHHPQMPPLA
ncbi:MAG: hypothetical protein V4641_05545 [Pseudomonadota bacterium]